MSVEEIKHIIEEHYDDLCFKTQKKIFSADQFAEIKTHTSFLENPSFKERLFCIYNDVVEKALCPICKEKSLKFESFSFGYRKYCSSRCASKDKERKEKIRNTCFAKYGSSSPLGNNEIREKGKETFLKNYLVDNPAKSEEIKEKIKKTNLEKYGVEWVLQSKEIRNMIKNTCKEKYGTESIAESEWFKEKTKQTFQMKYHADNFLDTKEFKIGRKQRDFERFKKRIDPFVEILSGLETYPFIKNETLIKFKCKRCNGIFEETAKQMYPNGKLFNAIVIPRCPVCYPYKESFYRSSAEDEIIQYIESLGIRNYLKNDKTQISPYELDIYLPDYGIAIEFNGIYWHDSERKEKDYHKLKTNLCENKNIFLLQVWEDYWNDPIKQEIYKSIILNKLEQTKDRIFARKCQIKEISNTEYREFISLNHLQGMASSKIKIGLIYNNDIVSVMSFGKPRFNKKYEYEMIRFCNKKFTSVIGGASRLFKYFVNTYRPKTIISYSLKDISEGNLYKALNFKYINDSSPNYFYVNVQGIRYTRQSFQKHKLSNILKKYDSTLSESENLRLNNYHKIYDSGSKAYEWKTQD